ncbi:alcohol dehydrogenase catalytic domain-containing protein [Paraburkholderia dipogonis]|uniref:Alcohol dehydrogenase catalytic domain-containing protein n=1 Tax=Paraburkholderia dipogonis TaxID=1211383 RepID=A0ABW9ARU8_9BURK
MSITAVFLNKDGDQFSAQLKRLEDNALESNPLAEGEVLVRIEHSGINYKDGLAIANRSPVVRAWPMVAGVDGVGTVEYSSSEGHRVVVTGWGLGETHWGCLAQRASVLPTSNGQVMRRARLRNGFAEFMRAARQGPSIRRS